MKGALWTLLGSLALIGLTSCSNYRLGTGGQLSFASLYIEPVKNKVLLAQTQAIMTTQIREAFEQDGRVELVDASHAADATLQVSLTNYHRDVASTREDDTGLARSFQLTLSATCTLRDNRTGKLLFEDRVISVRRNAFTDNGIPLNTQANGQFLGGLVTGNQLQSEYNTFPLLAKAMADKVAHAVLDVW